MERNEIVAATGCSEEIAEDAAEYGYVPRLLRDNGLSGDPWRALFDCSGGVQALVTDGGARTLWSAQYSSADWAAIVSGAFD